jgi:hypothetical protein
LEEFLEWVIDNKKWLFSGAGIFVFSWIVSLIFKKKRYASSTQTIRSGDNSTNIQSGRDVIFRTKKRNHVEKSEHSISYEENSINVIANQDAYFYIEGNGPTELVDQKTKEEIEKLKKSRFFFEFDMTKSSLRLGRHLIKGDLSSGSSEVRGRALVWCAILLSPSEYIEQAEEFLALAKTLGDFPEAKIAEAFIISQKGDKAAALNALAYIDSEVTHSAAFMIVEYHDGAEGALSWLDDACYTIGDLDSDGKSFFLNHQLQLGHWDEVERTIGAFSEPDFEETPILHHLVGLATLIPAIHKDFRATILMKAPFFAVDFPLASDAVAMDARRAAHTHFLKAVTAANQLECLRAARIDDEYALWLELRDPVQMAHGKNRLKQKLCERRTGLGFVHYALQLGIKIDLDKVERDIEQNIAINGGVTIDTAIARFALAFAQPTPEEVANYINHYHNQLEVHIDSKLMWYYQIEILSRGGLPDRAKEILNLLVKEGIPVEQEGDFRRIISEARGSNPIESCKAQYEATRTLVDLIKLVAELENHQQWAELCEFGKILFEETHSLSDAERLVNSLHNTCRSDELVGFLKENNYLLSQSNHLRMYYAWGLYHEGAFIESRAALEELSDEVCNPNYRALQVSLAIATGDWTALSAYIADEYKNRDDRSAHDLISAAQLALHLGSPHAKDLVFKATAKADDDSAILAAAYFIATSAGWENDPLVFKWLEKAAELSENDGPLQRMSLKDFLDRKPKWDRLESETWRLLTQGQIPIFLAAHSLNRTLIDLMTFPALDNLSKTDPRRKRAIPAYSGKRVPLEFEVGGKAVALDANALLTLSLLKMLDVTLNAFETVYIPHSTLGWLFEERQKATFHQPSRIANAREVMDLLATDVLEKFTPSTISSSDLSAQVGNELAALIAEAEKVRDDDDTQHIVVRSAPVHQISSFMEEEADLSAHETVLSSCLTVVEKLRQKGKLTADEEKQARVYLQLNEKPWPNQPDIADGATLYLDDLSTSYFLHLGLLGKIKAAGLTAVVSPRVLAEANSLISYERISKEVLDIIEHIRASLNSRIESGQVKGGRSRNLDRLKENSIPKHPSVGIFALTSQCDVSIIDDRFLNQHANIDSGGAQMKVFSTLDLMNGLVSAGILSDNDFLEHRTQLRRAGYFFVPVSVEELERCLRESPVEKGEVAETAELKAIRESVLSVRMSEWLQLPEEVPWLNRTLKSFVHVLRNLWVGEADIEEITARSNWLVKLIDVRGWAHRLIPENADNVVLVGRAAHILLILTPPTVDSQSVVDAYWNWVEGRVLLPLQEQFPKVYQWLVNWYRSKVAELAATQHSEEANSWTKSPYESSIVAVACATLKIVPPLIRKSLLNDQSFREEYCFNTEAMLSLGTSGVSVQRSDLFDAVRAVFEGEASVKLTDTEDRAWNLVNYARKDELPNLVLLSDHQRLTLPDFSVLSGDSNTRIRSLEKSASDVNLPLSAKEEWRCILEERALEGNEVDAFHSDIRDTPVHVERTIQKNITTGEYSVSSLVPNSRRYFERLVGSYDGSDSIRDYAVGAGREVFRQLTEWQPYEGFLFSLFLSSHSALTAEINADHLDQEDLEKAFNFLENHGDTLSRLGAFEVGLRILPDRPEVGPFLLQLVHLIRDDNVEGEASELKLYSALFVLVDGELARTHLLDEEPPFYRRLASLAQAALIHRQLVQFNIDLKRFSDWAIRYSGEHFYMQTLADMRTEPRWNPELAAASQMQEDFFGRIMNAGNNFEKNLGEGELRDTILGDEEQSLIKLCVFPRPYFPGPLEGADSPNALPEDIARIIEERLDSNEVEASSFIDLVNSVMIFRITSFHAELAAKALRLGNYTLANLEDKSQLVYILNGLATVAAVSRNPALADELRIIVRRYRRDSEYGFSIKKAMNMCLIASASRKDLMEWRQFAGEWLTELAFGELEGNEGEILHSLLLALLHSVPELWISCARADATLQAWLLR